MPSELDEEDYRFLDSATRVEVTVARTYLGEDPEEVWSETFYMTPEEVGHVRAEVQGLIPPASEYSIHKTEGQTSWGADSGEVVNVVLLVTATVASGVIQQATADLFSRYRQRRIYRVPRPLTREEAISRAKWAVAARYAPNAHRTRRDELVEDGLIVVGEAEDVENHEWSVRIRTPAGWLANVTVGPAGEDLVYIRRLEAIAKAGAEPAT